MSAEPKRGVAVVRRPETDALRCRQILLASHGTPGALAAEALAVALCAEGGTLHHLLVVPDLWKGMMGDDWLNNVTTRIRFGEYLESELAREADGNFERVARLASEHELAYRAELRQGEPVDCLIALQRELDCDAVIIGAPRPKALEGLRSRMRLDDLLRALSVPLVVAPHPGG